jgi:hypothetical protein
VLVTADTAAPVMASSGLNPFTGACDAPTLDHLPTFLCQVLTATCHTTLVLMALRIPPRFFQPFALKFCFIGRILGIFPGIILRQFLVPFFLKRFFNGFFIIENILVQSDLGTVAAILTQITPPVFVFPRDPTDFDPKKLYSVSKSLPVPRMLDTR